MARKILKGKSHTKQLDHVDKILSRLLTKPSYKLAATPTMFGGYVPAGEGMIFGFVAPWEGRVLGGAIFVKQKHKDSTVDVVINLLEREAKQSFVFSSTSGLIMFEKELHMVRGDRLTAFVKTDMPDELFGTYCSILFIPELRDFQKVWSPEGILKEIEDAGT